MSNYFITNREILNNRKIREDGQEHAGDNLRFGSYDIATKTFFLFPEPEATSELSYDMLSNLDVESLKGSSRFFIELYRQLVSDNIEKTTDGKDKADVLFFIHGFNTNLKGVRKNFQTLYEKYVANPNCTVRHLVIFTWPGMTKKIPLHYNDEKKDAIRSGECLARGITKLEDFFRLFLYKAGNTACNRKIHMMVHSMGHRVLKHMLLSLNDVPEIFDQILLMAADIEYDVFESGNAFYKTIDMGKRVHVYFHEKDIVLDLSQYTKTFQNRLGRCGRKEISPSLSDVIDVNATKTKDDPEYGFEEDKLNHWYYYSSSEVVNDIIGILKGDSSKIS